MRERLGRLASGGEIRATLKGGKHYGTPVGYLRVLPNEAGEHRLCVITSRQVGKAHDRNLVRRRVREIVRRNAPRCAPWMDLVFRAKPGSADVAFPEFREAILGALRRARLLREPFSGVG